MSLTLPAYTYLHTTYVHNSRRDMASFWPLFVIERRLHGGQSYLKNAMYDNCYSQSPSPRPVLMYFYIPVFTR